MTNILGENKNNNVLEKTLNIISPIKNKFSKPDCKVHIFIQENTINSLWLNGYYEVYEFFNRYRKIINEGVVWADQDLKCYCHFFNVFTNKGLPGADDNALTLAKRYYEYAIDCFYNNDINQSMFYLGAACHLVQDTTVPQHATGDLLNNHMQFENYVKANYLKIKRFKTYSEPILFDNIEEYIRFNSSNAIKTQHMYKHIQNLSTRFYLIAEKALEFSQKTTAGILILYFKNTYMQNYKNQI
ncbi:zinc dependent phospholipase C family protein [Intestinibacter sp.]